MAFHGLIPAAGNGFRFGSDLPKQYLSLHGRPILLHAIERLRRHFDLTSMSVVVAHDDHWFEEKIGALPNVTLLRCGGATRAESVRNALERLGDVAADGDWIIVHDAVRPCLDSAASTRLRVELADDPVGGFLAVPVSDTLKRLNGDSRVQRTEPRSALWRAQTPQMFRYRVLREAFAMPGLDRWTDEAHAVETLGLSPRCVQGSPSNVKITFPDDLPLAAAILAQNPFEEET